jgi:hypothetical protein
MSLGGVNRALVNVSTANSDSPQAYVFDAMARAREQGPDCTQFDDRSLANGPQPCAGRAKKSSENGARALALCPSSQPLANPMASVVPTTPNIRRTE